MAPATRSKKRQMKQKAGGIRKPTAAEIRLRVPQVIARLAKLEATEAKVKLAALKAFYAGKTDEELAAVDQQEWENLGIYDDPMDIEVEDEDDSPNLEGNSTYDKDEEPASGSTAQVNQEKRQDEEPTVEPEVKQEKQDSNFRPATVESEDQEQHAGEKPPFSSNTKGQQHHAKEKHSSSPNINTDPQKPENHAKKEPLFNVNFKTATEDKKSSSPSDDSDDERPLVSSQPSQWAGQQVKTCAWTSGRGISYINMYRNKNGAAQYRLDKLAESGDYEDNRPAEQNASNCAIRYGAQRKLDGTFKYTRRHIIDVYGVAWKRTGEESDLNLIDPEKVDLIDPKEVDLIEPKKRRQKWPPTYILIQWEIDGKRIKRWEPRSTLRDRRGKKVADQMIFAYAKDQENKYNEVQLGTRADSSRSPSVGLASETTRQLRQQSFEPATPTKGHSNKKAHFEPPPRPATATKANVGIDESLDLEQLRQEFLDMYLELAGVQDISDLPPKSIGKCLAAWKIAKAEAIAA